MTGKAEGDRFPPIEAPGDEGYEVEGDTARLPDVFQEPVMGRLTAAQVHGDGELGPRGTAYEKEPGHGRAGFKMNGDGGLGFHPHPGPLAFAKTRTGESAAGPFPVDVLQAQRIDGGGLGEVIRFTPNSVSSSLKPLSHLRIHQISGVNIRITVARIFPDCSNVAV